MPKLDLNAFTDITEEQQKQLVEFIGATYDEMVAETGTYNEELMLGLDKLLQGLRREGHIFT